MNCPCAKGLPTCDCGLFAAPKPIPNPIDEAWNEGKQAGWDLCIRRVVGAGLIACAVCVAGAGVWFAGAVLGVWL